MEPWIPFLYVYGVGGIVFVASLVGGYVAGAIDLRRPSDRRTLAALIGGLLLFASIHASWITMVARDQQSTFAHRPSTAAVHQTPASNEP